MVATRSTKRSVRSRMSRVSTKPDSATEYIGRASTPCATRAVFQVAIAKPAATAATMTATGNTFAAATETQPRKVQSDHRGDRQNRLMLGCEIERDAGTERDRHPRQQPAGAGLRANPVAQRWTSDGQASKLSARNHRPARPAAGPGSGIASLRPGALPALPRGYTCDPVEFKATGAAVSRLALLYLTYPDR